MLTEEEWDRLKDMLYQLMATTRDADIVLGLIADGNSRAIALGEEVTALRMVLHDLRRDSDAYRRGWREACEACAVTVSLSSKYGPLQLFLGSLVSKLEGMADGDKHAP